MFLLQFAMLLYTFNFFEYTRTMNTKLFLEEISERCLSELTMYRFNKGLNISNKHRKGKIAALEYVLNLIYHFYQKDKELKLEFENIIISQIEDISLLKDGEYKNAITEILQWTKTELHSTSLKKSYT